jgi:hypothetical protein
MSNMKIILMLYHLLAFLLLVTAAILQINDPDPLLWGGFFSLCALIPLLSIFKLDVRILYPLCLVYGIVVLVPTIGGFLEYIRRSDSESLLQGMSPDKPYIEEARELLGALIALGLITVSMLGQKWAAVTHR